MKLIGANIAKYWHGLGIKKGFLPLSTKGSNRKEIK